MVPVVTSALIGLGGKALAPALGAAGQALATVIDPQAKAYQQQLKKDTEALKQGKLGFSEAQKRSMLAGTQRALQAQTAGVEANLRRQAAAAGGFGRSGAQTRALGELASTQGEKLTQRQGDIDALSQQQAQSKFQDVMSRLARQRDEARATGIALGGAGASAIQEGVAAFPGVKATYLTERVSNALNALGLAKKGGDPNAVAAAQKAYDAALAASGGQ